MGCPQLSKIVSILSFVLLVAIGAHFSGVVAAERRWASASIYTQAKEFWRSWQQVDHAGASPLLPDDEFRRVGARQRFLTMAGDGPPIVVPGGNGVFRELCGANGCLAVAFGRDGKPVWLIPFDAGAMARAPLRGTYDHDYLGNDRTADIAIAGIRSFADGDLLLTFNLANAFPYSYGLMRVARDGTVRWRRADLANHRATIASDGTIYTPLHRIRSGERYSDAPDHLRGAVLCRTPEKQYVDLIQLVGPDGRERRTIDLLALFLRDPVHGPSLARTTDPCDPLHLNSVDIATQQDAASTPGIAAGDFIVSLRALSMVAIISADGQRIKRTITGSFAVQHSAHFLGNGEIVLFDNMGGSPGALPSRIIAIDLASGRERVIYARKPAEGGNLAELSPTAGDIALSPDRTRALVSFTRSGRLVEIDLASGEAVTRYDHTQGKDGGVYKLYAATYASDAR